MALTGRNQVQEMQYALTKLKTAHPVTCKILYKWQYTTFRHIYMSYKIPHKLTQLIWPVLKVKDLAQPWQFWIFYHQTFWAIVNALTTVAPQRHCNKLRNDSTTSDTELTPLKDCIDSVQARWAGCGGSGFMSQVSTKLPGLGPWVKPFSLFASCIEYKCSASFYTVPYKM